MNNFFIYIYLNKYLENMKHLIHMLLFILLCSGFSCKTTQREAGHGYIYSDLAPTPPMGWNSFDAYDCRINEADFKATVDYMAEYLKPYGYQYAVVDYIWWHPEPGNWDTPRRKGHPNLRYEQDGKPLHPEYITMDGFGRLLPAVERFPSAANGSGFKPLADYVHGKGLKFGMHIMRGIHRSAVYQNTPIKGTDYTAGQIGEPWDTCNWCNHMYGVDPSKPGAQDYYNLLFDMYAGWGVDYIKADDILSPVYHRGEIELIRNAIEHCGRPMVLSLSPGEAPLTNAKHLSENAHLWRVSNDLWDEWEDIEHNFELLAAWSSYIGPGNWPDADMIPVGKISLEDRPHGPERMCMLSWDEQVLLMSLWSMARSPLMIGADLLTLPDSTLWLLTNDEVLYINQHSTDNRQVIRQDRRNVPPCEKKQYYTIWTATDPANGDKFVGLFNLLDEESEVCFNLEWEMLRGDYLVRDLWQKTSVGTAEGTLCATLGAHGAALYRLSKK
jgi:hypothetical protein